MLGTDKAEVRFLKDATVKDIQRDDLCPGASEKAR